jgi:hypothetical protein
MYSSNFSCGHFTEFCSPCHKTDINPSLFLCPVSILLALFPWPNVLNFSEFLTAINWSGMNMVNLPFAVSELFPLIEKWNICKVHALT